VSQIGNISASRASDPSCVDSVRLRILAQPTIRMEVTMSFTDAIRSVFSQYVGFTGRARRSEYWYWVLFTIILSVIASLLQRAVNNSQNGVITSIVGLAILLPSLAVAVRRLHDTSRSGWWILLGLIPVVGTIILIVFYVQDSHGDNQYGPSPKAVGSTANPAGPGPQTAPDPGSAPPA
jgi:uncharacterized membrane protein YhaH (DUF805 family)